MSPMRRRRGGKGIRYVENGAFCPALSLHSASTEKKGGEQTAGEAILLSGANRRRGKKQDHPRGKKRQSALPFPFHLVRGDRHMVYLASFISWNDVRLDD